MKQQEILEIIEIKIKDTNNEVIINAKNLNYEYLHKINNKLQCCNIGIGPILFNDNSMTSDNDILPIFKIELLNKNLFNLITLKIRDSKNNIKEINLGEYYILLRMMYNHSEWIDDIALLNYAFKFVDYTVHIGHCDDKEVMVFL